MKVMSNHLKEDNIVEATTDEAEMEREENRLSDIFLESSPFIMNIWDDSVSLISTSRMSIEMFGLENQEQYIERFGELSPEHQPCGERSDMKAFGFVKQALKQDERVKFEWMHCNLAGESLPTEVTLSRFKHHNRYYVAAYTVDLRPIREADERVREAERSRELSDRIHALFDAAPVAIGMYDEDLSLVNTNIESAKLYGFDDKDEFHEAFNTRRNDFVPATQPCGTPSYEFMRNSFKQADTEGRFRFEALILSKNGEEVPLDITIIKFTSHESSLYVVYLRDMREYLERKRAEVAEESNRAKTRFLARMSHEIRTPITAVAGISEIQLQNPELPSEIEESFSKIFDSSNLLLGIVNDILDLSKIEADKMSLVSAKYDIANLISDAVQPQIILLQSRNFVFHLHVDEHMPRYLIGDAIRIRQIISNILSNAFKYTESGSVKLSVECQKDEVHKERTIFVISISDTGFGMNEDQLNTLLNNEYMRFHERDMPYVSGTGLGMVIVNSLVALMDATIDIESEVDKGTTVVVRIPQEVSGNEMLGKNMAGSLERFEINTRAAAKRFKFTPDPMPYGQVLVVDDVEANLYVVRGLLAFYDLNVDTCDSGEKAIDLISQGKVYDIVFMDQMMPGLSGLETMQALRDMGYNEPIVALTANALIGQAEELMSKGFDGFLSKPIQTANLNAELIKFIKEKQPPEVIEAALKSRKGNRGGIDDFQRNPDLIKNLRFDFADNYRNIFSELCSAIDSGDIQTAHRLAHTTKGSAGLINERDLEKVAEKLEKKLSSGEICEVSLLSHFERELNLVLSEIGEPEVWVPDESDMLSYDESLALLDRALPLLQTNNISSMHLIDELRKVPQSADLCKLITNYDFSSAVESLKTLKVALAESH